MGKRRNKVRAIVGLLATAALVGMPWSATHAYTLIGCRWTSSSGSAPQVFYLNIDPNRGVNPQYRAIGEEAINNWNYVNQGRISFHRAAAGPGLPVASFDMDSAYFGAGNFNGYWQASTGACVDGVYSPKWELRVNQDRLDPYVTSDPSVVKKVYLHELGHALGLWHVAVDANCNIMSSGIEPWVVGAPCQGMGGIVKEDDIRGSWSIYPVAPPKPQDVTDITGGEE